MTDDRPTATPDCALCEWRGNTLIADDHRGLSEAVQRAVVAHHVTEHGLPPTYGGHELLTYDPRFLYALTVPKRTHGLLVLAGDTVRVLDDDARVDLLDGLTSVETAVLAGRLRAWAERLMERDLIPRTGDER